MIIPTSPDPRMTILLPGRSPSTFTILWAVPAVKIPAGRLPGICTWSLVLSRQPMARTTLFALILKTPSFETAVISLSGESLVTIVSSITSTPRSITRSANRWAYSGPVRSSPK